MNSMPSLRRKGMMYTFFRWLTFDVCEYKESGILSEMIAHIIEKELLPHWGPAKPAEHFVYDIASCIDHLLREKVVSVTHTHFIYNEWQVKGYLYQYGKAFLFYDPTSEITAV